MRASPNLAASKSLWTDFYVKDSGWIRKNPKGVVVMFLSACLWFPSRSFSCDVTHTLLESCRSYEPYTASSSKKTIYIPSSVAECFSVGWNQSEMTLVTRRLLRLAVCIVRRQLACNLQLCGARSLLNENFCLLVTASTCTFHSCTTTEYA